MSAPRCPDCDRPLATQADFDAHPAGCQCGRCRSLCWSAWGGCSDDMDWRARALAAEAREHAALVAGAVQVAVAREALRKFGQHGSDCATRKPWPQDRPLPECDCGLDAALRALDGGGDVKAWLLNVIRGAYLGGHERTVEGHFASYEDAAEERLEEVLLEPPALPDATEALAEAFKQMDSELRRAPTKAETEAAFSGGDLPDPHERVVRTARRWLAGKRRER